VKRKPVDIAIHRVYAPKKSEATLDGFLNDRRVTDILRRVNGLVVEYESPAVVTAIVTEKITRTEDGKKAGRYSFRSTPSTKVKAHCTMTEFVQWAKEDVTDLMPKKGWRKVT
jgi:hypothetical protein